MDRMQACQQGGGRLTGPGDGHDHLFEEGAFRGEPVEMRCQGELLAITAEPVGPQRIDADEEQTSRGGLRGGAAEESTESQERRAAPHKAGEYSRAIWCIS